MNNNFKTLHIGYHIMKKMYCLFTLLILALTPSQPIEAMIENSKSATNPLISEEIISNFKNAINWGDVEKIDSILKLLTIEEQKELLDLKNNYGETPLHIAARNNNLNVLKKLFNFGADVSTRDGNGWTALHYAAQTDNPVLIEFLHKKNNSLINITSNKEKQTALHIACLNSNLEAVKTLIELDQNIITATDSRGWTALHYAAQGGKSALIEFLHDKDKNLINTTSNEANLKQTALHIACSNNNLEAVTKLVELGAKITARDRNGWTVLHCAAQTGNSALIKFLNEKNKFLINTTSNKDDCERTALHIACSNNNLEAVETLIELDQNITATTDSDGWTGLHWAAQEGNYDIIKFLNEKNKKLINTTSNKGNYEKTALHVACSTGNLKMVKTLIELGADITASDSEGWTVFHYAAENGNAKVIQTLFDNSSPALFLKENNTKETPARIAAVNRKKEALEKILELTKKANENQKKTLSTLMNTTIEPIKKTNNSTPKKQRNSKKEKNQKKLLKKKNLEKTDSLPEKPSFKESSPLPVLPTKSEINDLVDYQNKKTVTTPDNKLVILHRTWENAGGDATIFIKKPKTTGALGTAFLNLNTESPKKQDIFHKAVVSLITNQWLLENGRILTYKKSSPNDPKLIHYSKKYGILTDELEDGDILVLFPGFLCTGNSALNLFNVAKEMALKNSLSSKEIWTYFKQQAKTNSHIHKGAGLCIIRNINGTKTVIHSCFENVSKELF